MQNKTNGVERLNEQREQAQKNAELFGKKIEQLVDYSSLDQNEPCMLELLAVHTASYISRYVIDT